VKAIVTQKTKLVLDDTAPSATLSDANENTVTLDSNGIAFERGNNNVKITTSSVSTNDGALEVT
jgi:hypothetical protein